MTKTLTVVLTYGTFDLFHVGHLRLLQRLADMGDRLIVGVSTDEFNAAKGKLAVIPYADRAAIVAGIRGVDTVFAEENWDQKAKDIVHYGVTHFCMGDDWRGKFDCLKALCEVVYLERTEGVSSTKIRGQIIPITGTDTAA
jgi:glycerol-3-phosphate cytidylyltransferase